MAEATVVNNLLSGGWRTLSFEPFRDGIEICHLITGEPAVAVLQYRPGAQVPAHRHTGLETIVVLEGSQQDERGHYPAGSVVMNHPGSVHSVQSPEGCVVFIQWDRPVELIDGSA